MEKKHIYVLGYDEMNRNELNSVQPENAYNFHPLLYCGEMITSNILAGNLYHKAVETIRNAAEPPDAIIGHWDFPVSTMLPLLKKEAGLNSTSLESVVKCEHKYWCRTEQKKVIPEHIPDFGYINPFAEDPLETLDLDYPFWIKPVKSVSSVLGFRIHNENELNDALDKIRRDISWSAEPFNYFFKQCDVPDDIKNIDGYHCIVEEIISDGHQCTQEGFIQNGNARIYGTIDSIRYPGMSCFRNYQYPSQLPPDVLDRMTRISKTIIPALGYDNGPFNIEYFWNEAKDTIKLLEINPRISQSHSPLFRIVDGVSHHQVAVKTALGEETDFPQKQGQFPYAAKFMLRTFDDGIVKNAPDTETIRKLKNEMSEIKIINLVQPGQNLSDMIEQDSYSYELANIFLGGKTPDELMEKRNYIQKELGYEIEKTEQTFHKLKA